MKKRLNPKNDYLFKRLFGEADSKPLLIGLLNAVLRRGERDAIADLVVLDGKLLTKRLVEDKEGVLDIRCETADREQINVEMQVGRYRHMEKRSLFYMGRLLADSIREGEDYGQLKRTICINMLDFSFLPLDGFHRSFHLYEDAERQFRLTDLFELHFIEFPKFRSAPYAIADPLHRWLRFLDERTTHEQLEELIAMDPTIRTAEERLSHLSEDDMTRMLYEAREKANRDRISFLKDAREQGLEEGRELGIAQGRELGIAQGRELGKVAVALNLLKAGTDIAAVSRLTELPVDQVRQLAARLEE
ncbi:Rpn family recombination-promoting nuclease/putative transposase [Cohnella sp. GbtcB17]|uniref:Rpn family recombination-promoting nuclease/putative transposase n=1 Tax=Cohnella sp. GbtcB17 TaxID=2824762 RepID=UPI001C2FACDA|nr:Rpn family recombination-promoting nuclease/putative transposase [Cohnella sp. GbtcB17]